MIYNTIMVQLNVDGPSAARLRFARDLAERFEADLIGFAACNIHPMIATPGVVGDGELVHLEADEIRRRLKVLQEQFEAEVGSGQRMSWRSVLGDPTRELAEAARAADLTVAGPPSAEFAGDVYRAIDLGEIVLSAGRPVLIPADHSERLDADNVLVAWKDTRESRRAIVDAMPFLVNAREVLVATLEDQDRSSAAASVADVVRFLMKHGARARSDVFSHEGDDDGATLVSIAKDAKADLIVSGGYGHSRIREWAFGGVTRSLLSDGSINRLMSY